MRFQAGVTHVSSVMDGLFAFRGESEVLIGDNPSASSLAPAVGAPRQVGLCEYGDGYFASGARRSLRKTGRS